MASRRRASRRWLGRWLAVGAMLLAACSEKGTVVDDAPPTTAPTATTTTGPTTTTVTAVSISFSDRTPPLELGGGWSVARCEGDAPLLCPSRGGQPVGRIELATFPVDSFALPRFKDAVAAGDVARAMEVLSDDFVATFRKDRAEGCGAAYRVEPIESEAATVLGRPGLRYGFEGFAGDTLVERHVNHGTIIDDEIVLVNAPGYAAHGCVPPEGEFTVESLRAFEPYLRAIVASASR